MYKNNTIFFKFLLCPLIYIIYESFYLLANWNILITLGLMGKRGGRGLIAKVYVIHCQSVKVYNLQHPSGWFWSMAPQIYFVLKSELKPGWLPLSWVKLQIVSSFQIVYLVFDNVNVFYWIISMYFFICHILFFIFVFILLHVCHIRYLIWYWYMWLLGAKATRWVGMIFSGSVQSAKGLMRQIAHFR